MRTQGACTASKKIRAAQLLTAAAAMAVSSISSAAITYNQGSSSVTITQDANSSSGGVDKTSSLQPPTSSSMTSFQLNNTIGTTTQSVAKGSIGSVTNPTTAAFTLASGSGITQVDPTHVWGPSILKFNVNGFWNTGSTNFGPTATGYFSMGYAGTVASGGSAQVKINLTFTEGANTLRTAISFIDTITTAGGFAKSYTSSKLLNAGTVGANKTIKVAGTVEFLVNNAGGPVDMSPIHFEMGNAPPTATFVSANGDFNDPANWNGTGPDFQFETDGSIPALPNQAGHRARIVNLSLAPGGARTINLPGVTTLGTLDIDDDDAVTFTSGGAGALNFDGAASGEAVIHTGNSQGTAATEITVPVSLATPMTIAVDSASEFAARPAQRGGGGPGAPNANAGFLNLSNTVSGAHSVTSVADGTVALTGAAPNTFTGGVHSRAGYIDANKAGALGSGTATIQDSQLNYNTAGASAPNTVTQVSNLGEFKLSDITITPSDRVSISDLAAVDAVDLTQFNTNAATGSVNLQLAPGAMIAHQQFAPNPATGNPTGLDPTTPLYVFGVSRFFGNGDIVVGSDSASPWRGFGGPRGNFLFGDGGQGNIQIAGAAELVSLRGTMVIDSQLTAVGPTTPSLTIRGGGLVVINSPPAPFNGPITVESGALAITSAWTPTQITVGPNGAIAGPGVSVPLIFLGGGSIAPGDTGGISSIGTFTAASSVAMADTTQWNFDLDVPGIVGAPNDLLVIDGATTLDGVINVNGLENFGPGTYTLALLNGAVTDNDLLLGIVPPEYTYDIQVTQSFGVGQQVLLVVSDVPEPGSMGAIAVLGLVAGRRARRTTGAIR